MKVKIQQFLFGQNHSWSKVGQAIALELLNLKHDLHLISTDGVKPEYLNRELSFYLREPAGPYDLQLSYTAMPNFPNYLKHGSKNRFGIWCYEWPILPPGFAKYHIFADMILAPSHFAKDIFVQNKVPEEKIKVIPHGLNLDVANKNLYPLKTSKKNKILMDVGQSHLRKNIAGAFEAFGRAFTKQDDVCLVAKIHQKPVKAAFDVDVKKIFAEFKKKYPNHAEVELISHYIPNIVELYNACDIIYTLSYCEGFYIPGLNALATGKINVAPKYGGQLDFLNENNSFLVEGKVVRANVKMQYWTPSLHNTCFESDFNDAADKLRQAVTVGQEKRKNETFNFQDWSWSAQTKKILELCV